MVSTTVCTASVSTCKLKYYNITCSIVSKTPSQAFRRAVKMSAPLNGHQRQVLSYLLMSSGSVRTWFFTHVADLCKKAPSSTWWSECRTNDRTPATHTLLSLSRSDSAKVAAATVSVERGRESQELPER